MSESSRVLIFTFCFFSELLFLPLLVQAADGDDSLNIEIQCLYPPYDAPQTEAQLHMRRLLDVVQAEFPALPSIGEAFAARNPLICINNLTNAVRGYLEIDNNLIAVSQRLSFDEMVAILFHELRHLEQLHNSYCPSTAVSMQENARAIMAAEADAMAISTLIAFSMRENGNPGSWQAMLSWPNYADIPERFEVNMEKTGDIPTATAAAFAQWYESDWRTGIYFKSICSDYLDQLDRAKTIPRYDFLPDDFLDRLCHLPTGEAYDCDTQ